MILNRCDIHRVSDRTVDGKDRERGGELEGRFRSQYKTKSSTLGIPEFLISMAQYSTAISQTSNRLLNEVSVPDGGTHPLSLIALLMGCQGYI